MKRIEVRLNLDVVAPLLDLVRAIRDGLRTDLAVPPQLPEHDEEITVHWRDDLLRSQGDDLEVLLGLFDQEFFASGLIVLDEDNAEAVLRACSAVRLRIRERHLRVLGDDSLETGDIPLEEMTDPLAKAYAAYVFLATLQELIVQHLDPTASE